jgi:membrane-bound serine protease (ClpP class)
MYPRRNKFQLVCPADSFTYFSRGKTMHVRTTLLTAIITFLSVGYIQAEESQIQTDDTSAETVDSSSQISESGAEEAQTPSLIEEPAVESEDMSAPDGHSMEKTVDKVVVVPVEGTVNSAMAAFISRVLRDEKQGSGTVFILEMDTFGGEVDAAFQIVDTLVNVREATTIAYVKTKAISAGALIALACDRMIMKNSTTIGDVAPLTVSNGGPKMLGEKFQSPIRAKFRTLAKKNGYPQTLTEAMVTKELVVYKVVFPDTVMYVDSTELADLSDERKKSIIEKSTVVKKNELLTMDDSEAHELGFSEGSVGSFEEMLELAGLSGSEVIRYQRSWSEMMVGFIGKVAPLLMMIGLAALYIEIRTPGFGVPGIIGLICIGIVFFSQYMIGLADYTELLLFGIGLLLLAVEVFVLPGFGIAGFAAIGVLLAAMVLSLQGFVLPRPEFPWEKQLMIRNMMYASGSLVGAILLIILFFRYLFPRLGMVISGPYLHASLSDVHADETTEILLHPGDHGVAMTALRPSGKIDVNGIPFDVVAESMFIEKGEKVLVESVAGNRIVVVKEEG